MTIPASVTSVGGLAFSACTGLKSIHFTGKPPSISTSVFNQTPDVTVYYISGRPGWGTAFAGRPTAVGFPPPTITNSTIAFGIVGNPFNYTISANYRPTSFASTILPLGLSLDPLTGVISGIPSKPGTYTVTLSAINETGSGFDNLILTINELLYTVTGGGVTITGSNPQATGNLEIPATLGGLPVTSIGYGAFLQCAGLTSVTIPNSVTSIGGNAFALCSGLSSVTIPNSVTSIGGGAFAQCSGLTSVTIPNSVSSIGESAFYSCSGLTNLMIPDSVTSIGNYAFETCTGLTNVTIGISVNSIGYRAFGYCSGLAKVQFRGTAPMLFYSSVFDLSPVTVYYIHGRAGWSTTFAGRPTVAVGNPAPIITSSTTTIGTVGLSLIYTITADHTPTLFDAFGLPPGLTLDPLTGTISGIPTTTGTNIVTLSAINATGTGTQVLTLTVNHSPPVFTIYSTATVGLPYRYLITADYAPFLFTAIGLPTGLALDPLTGLIAGLPTTEGTFRITISAINAYGTSTQNVTMFVFPPPPEITSSTAISAVVGLPFVYTITANNSPTLFKAPGLPQGLSIDPLTGVISGTFLASGTHIIILTAFNASGAGNLVLTLSVNVPSRINFDPSRNQAVMMAQDEGSKEHSVEYTDDFKHWTPLNSKLVGAKDLSKLDPQADTRPFRFYRIIQPPVIQP